MAKDKVLRALRLLAEMNATQTCDHPLECCQPLIRDGFAAITKRWSEHANGRLWHCEEISITAAGRKHLQNMGYR